MFNIDDPAIKHKYPPKWNYGAGPAPWTLVNNSTKYDLGTQYRIIGLTGADEFPGNKNKEKKTQTEGFAYTSLGTSDATFVTQWIDYLKQKLFKKDDSDTKYKYPPKINYGDGPAPWTLSNNSMNYDLDAQYRLIGLTDADEFPGNTDDPLLTDKNKNTWWENSGEDCLKGCVPCKYTGAMENTALPGKALADKNGNTLQISMMHWKSVVATTNAKGFQNH